MESQTYEDMHAKRQREQITECYFLIFTDSEIVGGYILRGGCALVTHLPSAHRCECFLCSLANTQKRYCDTY